MQQGRSAEVVDVLSPRGRRDTTANPDQITPDAPSLNSWDGLTNRLVTMEPSHGRAVERVAMRFE
jgi:hypothetical protein